MKHDDLIGKVDRLQGQVARLTTTIKELRKQLAAAQRAGKRAGSAILQGRADLKAKASGSKAREGELQLQKAARRWTNLTAPPVDVSVSAESCPGCGGILEHEGESLAYVTDIPPMPRPAGDRVPGAGMPMRVVRQACARASSGRWT